MALIKRPVLIFVPIVCTECLDWRSPSRWYNTTVSSCVLPRNQRQNRNDRRMTKVVMKVVVSTQSILHKACLINIESA